MDLKRPQSAREQGRHAARRPRSACQEHLEDEDAKLDQTEALQRLGANDWEQTEALQVEAEVAPPLAERKTQQQNLQW